MYFVPLPLKRMVQALQVHSNSPRGFELEVLPLSPLFRALAIHGLEREVTLGADGGSVVQHWGRAQTASLSLTYRFYLMPGLGPGEYPWPLRLGVRPLPSGQ